MADMKQSSFDSDTSLPARPRADLCLDFANTRSWRGRAAPHDDLGDFGRLIDWCVLAGAIDAASGRMLAAWGRDHPVRATMMFGEALALRETIYRLFDRRPDVPPQEDDLDRLNRALAKTPARTTLRPTAGGLAWRVARLEPAAPSVLAAVLWSTADLLIDPRRRRVRACANAECRWVFLDDSKSGNRRWCAMSSCGNRAKAQRHYHRHKDR